MAFDKLIDSAKFDAAITASADAIRAKTGGTAKIPWDETTGLANAISGITFKTQSKSVTPKASSQTIKPDSGYNGLSQVTVNGDSDLKASNIAKGVNIFGVTGTLESGAKATGTFKGTDTDICWKPITISGLPFKPTRVIFFIDSNGSDLGMDYGILYGDSDGQFCLSKGYEEYYDEETEEYDGYNYTFFRTASDGFSITMNSGGFTISATNDEEYGEFSTHSDHTYKYIALG